MQWLGSWENDWYKNYGDSPTFLGVKFGFKCWLLFATLSNIRWHSVDPLIPLLPRLNFSNITFQIVFLSDRVDFVCLVSLCIFNQCIGMIVASPGHLHQHQCRHLDNVMAPMVPPWCMCVKTSFKLYWHWIIWKECKLNFKWLSDVGAYVSSRCEIFFDPPLWSTTESANPNSNLRRNVKLLS